MRRKEEEEEKEIYKEKEKNSFFSTKKGDLSEGEVREQILAKFFFRNYPKPAEEYRRLVAYNGSERWAEMTAAEQLDAADKQHRRHHVEDGNQNISHFLLSPFFLNIPSILSVTR